MPRSSDMEYVIWGYESTPHACRLEGLRGYSDTWKIAEGVAVADAFPADATFAMNPDFPDDTLMLDTLQNVDGMVVASTRLKDFLVARGVPDVEYLPVVVRNHKGRAVPVPYYIVHPIRPRPVLRLADCRAVMDGMVPYLVNRLGILAVDEDELASAPGLFRVQHLWRLIWTHTNLARELAREGFTGLRWLDPRALATGGPMPLLSALPPSARVEV